MRKPIAEVRGSCRRACCIGRESRGISATKPACARQPSGAACDGLVVACEFRGGSDECEQCSRRRRPFHAQSGCRSLCRVAGARLHPAAGRRSSRARLPDTWHRASWPAPWRQLKDRLDPRPGGSSWCRFSLDRWDWGRCPPPKTRFGGPCKRSCVSQRRRDSLIALS